MTEDGRPSWVRLDGLSDRQLALLREAADDWLVAKADDLPKGSEEADGVGREMEEVAALGRLVAGLRRGEVLVPDPVARELVARTIGETRRLDELREEYERELGEHESWVALLAHFDQAGDAGSTETEDDDDRRTDRGSPDVDAPTSPTSHWIELDGRLSEDQLRIVRREVTGLLSGRTDDLPILSGQADRERQFGEIAALARLAFWLARGEVQVPDPVAREMVGRLAEGSKDLNEWEELRERYEAGKAEHEALAAFAGILSEDPTGPGGDVDAR